jgi:hypothetical protein
MKKIISIFLLIFLSMPKIFAYKDFSKDIEKLNIDSNICKNIKQTDIPTIFIP